ncbi:MAG: TOBE domain-containing protein [Gammaproteobacteria bacterium]|nr:TOBE domain-containing protein [Gammaproteobacteria bacterium]
MKTAVDGPFWLNVEGRGFLGTGRIELLEHIAEMGSIAAAAQAADSSVLNCLPARVLEVNGDPHPGHVLVRLGLRDQILLARITRRSVEHLGLAPGMAVHALVKGVAIT